MRTELLLPLLAACNIAGPNLSSTEKPTFEEFEAATYREPWPGGVYIINGDTPVSGKKALREVWERMFANGALTVHHPGSVDAKWDRVTKRALTYCVSDEFGANKPAVLAAMAAAAERGWEAFANVDFIHVVAEDARCDEQNLAVLFDVRPVFGQPYLARAFFPGAARDSSNVFIDQSSFEQTDWELSNILAHELGHVLGFRHEHTRPESGACFEDTEWRPLTQYDAASVMHYPHCNGTNPALAFSEVDAQGAAALYGLPGQDPPEPIAPDSEHRQSGALMADEQLAIRAFSVKPGSIFKAVLTGTGDADLYVRFGEAPQLAAFDCRPFLDQTSDESCTLDVPANVTVAHVMIHGFTEVPSFELVVSWADAGGAPAAQLVIEEILADPSVIDANGDGRIDVSEDEMIEVVNIGSGPADLTGATISDATGIRVVLPAIVVQPGEVLVVFGGGTPAPLGPGVHIATGPLSLNNTGDVVTLRDTGGAVLATASYGSAANHDVSVVRARTLDPTAAFVRHTSVSTLRASPGRRSDGSPYQ
jgi:serine protease